MRRYLSLIMREQSFFSKELQAAMVLYIFPKFGPSSGKYPKKQLDKTTIVYEILGDAGMKTYKRLFTLTNI